jgi:hypothetical protein
MSRPEFLSLAWFLSCSLEGFLSAAKAPTEMTLAKTIAVNFFIFLTPFLPESLSGAGIASFIQDENHHPTLVSIMSGNELQLNNPGSAKQRIKPGSGAGNLQVLLDYCIHALLKRFHDQRMPDRYFQNARDLQKMWEIIQIQIMSGINTDTEFRSPLHGRPVLLQHGSLVWSPERSRIILRVQLDTVRTCVSG